MSDETSVPPFETQSPPSTDIPALLSGIIKDFQSLIKQQFQLTRQEITANLKLRGTVTAMFAAAVALAGLAIVMLCHALAHGLHWWTLDVTSRPPGMPIAACYGIVGGLLFTVGAILVNLGRRKLRNLPSLPHPTDERDRGQQS